MRPPLLALQDVDFAAQQKIVVQSITTTFPEGYTTAIVGPSGSGKSTVLKLAAGLILPTKGSVKYNGVDISLMTRKETLAYRKASSFVFQDSALWANQTIRQIMELPLKIHFPMMRQSERTEHIQAALYDVGYKRELDIRPSQLSMGEQKLIAFARAMLCKPELLYLDEWTESLDEAAAERLVNLVEHEKIKQTTIIFVSHNFGIVKKLADYIYMVKDGRLALTVPMAELETNKALYQMIEKGIDS